jgi:hypothetical protein
VKDDPLRNQERQLATALDDLYTRTNSSFLSARVRPRLAIDLYSATAVVIFKHQVRLPVRRRLDVASKMAIITGRDQKNPGERHKEALRLCGRSHPDSHDHAAQRRVKRPRHGRVSGNMEAPPRGPLERIVWPRAEAETCLRQRHGLAPTCEGARSLGECYAAEWKHETDNRKHGAAQLRGAGDAKRARGEHGGNGAKPRGVLANATQSVAEAKTTA